MKTEHYITHISIRKQNKIRSFFTIQKLTEFDKRSKSRPHIFFIFWMFWAFVNLIIIIIIIGLKCVLFLRDSFFLYKIFLPTRSCYSACFCEFHANFSFRCLTSENYKPVKPWVTYCCANWTQKMYDFSGFSR